MNLNTFDTVSPLDYRYYGGEKDFFERLRPYVSEASNIKYELQIEAALVEELASMGICSQRTVEEVKKACEEITTEEVYEEEAKIQHNIRALVNCIRRRISPESRPFVHLFATSADIMDTATALRYKDLVRSIVLPDLISFEETLIGIARDNADVLQMGRTHGKHAEPITFGFAIALYVSRLGNRIEKIAQDANNLRGKFSGAVGAYNALSLVRPTDPASFEISLLSRVGLKPSDTSISTQIVEPEYVTDLIYSVESCFSVLANLADDIRHLHRTEIAEIEESYKQEKVGSSTMPHKVNPKNFENVKSLWKAFMPRMITVFMDQISEHQRDLTNSASSRFATEIITALVYATMRLDKALQSVHANTKNMRRNFEVSKDSIIAEPLYIILALQGYPNAYDYVRELIRKNGANLSGALWDDLELKPFLAKATEEQKRILQNPSLYTGASSQRTIATCEEWEHRCFSLKARL